MDVGSATDTGRVRERNEDALLVDANRNLFVVADGLGGHAAGDVASRIAIERIGGSLDGGVDPRRDLAGALRAAHDAIVQDVRDHRERAGMGTTAVVAHLADGHAHLAHVGDSRAYLLRRGELQQVTVDHSDGLRITQALGTTSDIAPDVTDVELVDGDRLILCTDGLTDMVADDEIRDITEGAADAQTACDRLVQTALAYGGVDNVTVIVVAP